MFCWLKYRIFVLIFDHISCDNVLIRYVNKIGEISKLYMIDDYLRLIEWYEYNDKNDI